MRFSPDRRLRLCAEFSQPLPAASDSCELFTPLTYSEIVCVAPVVFAYRRVTVFVPADGMLASTTAREPCAVNPVRYPDPLNPEIDVATDGPPAENADSASYT